MVQWSFRRQARRIQGLFVPRHRLRRQCLRLARLLAITMVFMVVVVFVTPARNFVGYYIMPAMWIPLSSGQIIRMFFIEEQRISVESGDEVTCAGVEGLLKKVDWQKIVSEMPNLPAYDEEYYKSLTSNPSITGVSPEDVQMLKEKLHKFQPPMSALWQRRLRMTFKVFHAALQLFNVTYFMSEGSMLGAYRHHGYIPWDDDMDLIINGSDWLKVKQILHCIPDFDVDTRSYMMYKFFWKNSARMKNDDVIHVPYIDIFFYTEDVDYIWALSSIKKHRIFFKKTDIFPLTYRPFEDQMAALPKEFENLCKSMYDPTVCVSRDYDHLNERPLIPFLEYEYRACDVFKKFYPFVERLNVSVNGKPATVEVKKLGNKLLSNFTVFH